jgi:hypothetical protein
MKLTPELFPHILQNDDQHETVTTSLILFENTQQCRTRTRSLRNVTVSKVPIRIVSYSCFFILISGQIAVANPSTKGNGETAKRERKRNGTSQKIRWQFNRYKIQIRLCCTSYIYFLTHTFGTPLDHRFLTGGP